MHMRGHEAHKGNNAHGGLTLTAGMIVPAYKRILRTLHRSYRSHKRSAKETRHCCSGHTERPQRLGTSHAQGSRTLARERCPLPVTGES
ncbi:DNA primase [Sesbania bispinosa]|nr:DNA primase [Sesbania bispinosa]